MIVRGESLRSSLTRYLPDRINSASNVHDVLTNCEVTALKGEKILERITVTNRRTGESQTCATHWLFVCIGGEPRTTWAEEVGIVCDAAGYLVTGPDLLRDNQPPPGWPLDRNSYYLETNMPGIFAAGDVRHGSVKRCASVAIWRVYEPHFSEIHVDG